MLYHISWAPQVQDIMSGCGFIIKLFPRWRREIIKSKLNQEDINNLIECDALDLLKNNGFDTDRYKGSNFLAKESFYIAWGEWGLEHITIPGTNATGLDIEDSPGAPKNGRILVPHNIDHLRQASLLLAIFTRVADCIVSKIELEESEKDCERQVNRMRRL